jgi:hypothetical protein
MSDMNFIPAERLRTKRCKARLHLWAVVCGTYIVLLVVASLAGHILCPGRDADLAKQLAAAENQIKQNNAAMLELRRVLANTTAAMETSRAIRRQPDWSRLLTGLVHELGQELVLSRCQLVAMREDGKPLTEPWSEAMLAKPLCAVVSKHQYQLVLHGFGQTQESVSRFVLGLEGIGLFERVRLVNSSRQKFLDGQAVAFAVECCF